MVVKESHITTCHNKGVIVQLHQKIDWVISVALFQIGSLLWFKDFINHGLGKINHIFVLDSELGCLVEFLLPLSILGCWKWFERITKCCCWILYSELR